LSRNNKRRNHTSGKRLSKVENIAILVIIVIAVWAVYSLSQPTQSQGVTSSALDFTLPEVGPNGLNGQSVSLSQFRGKVVLLEFMEPWCPHCQNMAPILDNLYKQYGSNVIFISVAGPWQGATAQDTAKFIKDYSSNWIYLYDSPGTIFSKYGINSTPTFFIIGKDGSVYNSYQGEQPINTLASDLTRVAG
jgi:thiol-disulfide isomerase/thioredoxin